MKLKKEVKEKLIITGMVVLMLLSLNIVTKTGEKAYNDCMSKNNDANFCHKLIES